jgi:hypothetical protein
MMRVAQKDKQPVHVHCGMRVGGCGHEWIAAYLPMEARRFAKMMTMARCPMCGEPKTAMLGRFEFPLFQTSETDALKEAERQSAIYGRRSFVEGTKQERPTDVGVGGPQGGLSSCEDAEGREASIAGGKASDAENDATEGRGPQPSATGDNFTEWQKKMQRRLDRLTPADKVRVSERVAKAFKWPAAYGGHWMLCLIEGREPQPISSRYTWSERRAIFEHHLVAVENGESS